MTAGIRGLTDPGARGPAAPAEYFAWNQALGEHFYNEANAQQPVYLDIEADVLAACAREVGTARDPEEAFLAAVRPTLGRAARLFDWHVNQLDRWKSRGAVDEPPCVALLALASYAAEQMQRGKEIRATNYYVPFFSLAGRLDEYTRSPLVWQKGYRRHIKALWDALNGWLEDWEGERGLPTARSRGQNWAVSMAISQALVREADRAHLPRFFSWTGLRPGVDIDEQRMERLLDGWVPTSPLSRRIKSRWGKSAELREAFASVAATELLTWDGVVGGAGSEGFDVRLIAVTSRRRPLRVLVAVEGCGERPTSSVEIGGSAHEPDWVELWPGTWLDRSTPARDPLSHDVRVGDEQREWRRVNVFRLEGARWVETRSVDRESTHLLLAESNFTAVPLLLEKIAPGFRAQPDEVAGWTAYHDVRVVGTPDADEIPGELKCLAPLTRYLVLLKGGLKYPGRPSRWHPADPPQVVVSVMPGDEYMVLLEAENEEGAQVDLGPGQGPGIFDIPPLEVEDGNDYVVAIEPVGRRVRLPMRTSARTALAYDAEQPPELCRCATGGPVRGLWGHPVTEACPAPTPLEPASEASSPPGEVAWDLGSSAPATPGTGLYVEFNEAVGIGSQGLVSRYPPCTEGGYCLSFEKPGARVARAACVYCGCGPRDRDRLRRLLEELPEISRITPPTEALRGGQAPTWAIMDALGHVRGGTVERLHRWLANVGLDAIARHALLADLQALGYLEFSAPGASGTWHVNPPGLVPHPLAADRWLLVGLYSPADLGALRELVEGHGGTYGERLTSEHHATAGLPLRTASGLAHEAIEDIAEAAGATIHQDGGALSLGLPAIAAAVEEGTQLRDLPPSRDIEYYDARQAGFRPAGANAGRGLLRIEVGYTSTYWWAEHGGMGRELPDVQTGKVLAAREAAVPGFAYLGDALLTPMGARLPGLYERAVVMASFDLPVFKRGVTAYQGVDEKVAANVYRALYA